MNIGEAIRIVRNRRGLRQKELAERLGVSQSHLSLIENDRRQATMDFVERLAQQLDVPVQLLVFLACDTTPDNERYRDQLRELGLRMLDMLRSLHKMET